MGTRSRRPLALSAAVLLLCALVAATSTPARWTGVELPWSDPVTSADGTDELPDDADRAGAAGDRDPGRDEAGRVVPGDLRTAGRLVLGLGLALAAGLVALAVLRFRLVRRRRRLTGRAAERRGATRAEDPAPDEAADPLVAALESGARSLEEGSPRNAIVAAWLRLEDAVTADGFPRRPAETPAELVARALTTYRLDATAIGTLADLYEEARFSRHAVTEAHRAEAGRCLARLLASITTGREGVLG